mmetsp:Transcript_23851/g.68229  ORF Transcript_23851/g.68229 Transcript_23851/m.68229 type:complete len:147 (+) Transcript_23851:49-489(+)
MMLVWLVLLVLLLLLPLVLLVLLVLLLLLLLLLMLLMILVLVMVLVPMLLQMLLLVLHFLPLFATSNISEERYRRRNVRQTSWHMLSSGCNFNLWRGGRCPGLWSCGEVGISCWCSGRSPWLSWHRGPSNLMFSVVRHEWREGQDR